MVAKRNCPCSTWNMGGGRVLPSLQRRKERNSQQKQAWSEDHACLGKNGGWEWRCRKWGSVYRRGGWFLGGPDRGPARQDCTAGPRRSPCGSHGRGVSRGGLYRRGGWFWGDPPADRPGRIARRGQGTRPAVPTGGVFPCRPVPRGIRLPITRNQRDICLEFLCLLSL